MSTKSRCPCRSHTWSHPHLNGGTYQQISHQLELVEKAMVQILGVKPLYMRPPYGYASCNPRLKQKGFSLQTIPECLGLSSNPKDWYVSVQQPGARDHFPSAELAVEEIAICPQQPDRIRRIGSRAATGDGRDALSNGLHIPNLRLDRARLPLGASYNLYLRISAGEVRSGMIVGLIAHSIGICLLFSLCIEFHCQEANLIAIKHSTDIRVNPCENEPVLRFRRCPPRSSKQPRFCTHGWKVTLLIDGVIIARSHTWSHVHLNQGTYDQIDSSTRIAGTAMIKILGVKPLYMRPPYGEYNDVVLQVLRNRGYKGLVMWSQDSGDTHIPAQAHLQ
ncbi:hypothetical protein H4Q26_014924 [Puccinia striiformis f. sp. tritici PST-130]|nr:hypothetical protein H4Q26_014924 [Puccinia striiformis f. sp. tritici PST-130]